MNESNGEARERHATNATRYEQLCRERDVQFGPEPEPVAPAPAPVPASVPASATLTSASASAPTPSPVPDDCRYCGLYKHSRHTCHSQPKHPPVSLPAARQLARDPLTDHRQSSAEPLQRPHRKLSCNRRAMRVLCRMKHIPNESPADKAIRKAAMNERYLTLIAIMGSAHDYRSQNP